MTVTKLCEIYQIINFKIWHQAAFGYLHLVNKTFTYFLVFLVNVFALTYLIINVTILTSMF